VRASCSVFLKQGDFQRVGLLGTAALSGRYESSKAKYGWETDSEQVLRGKGEKHPYEGSEIVPETSRLQAVGASLSSDGVPVA